MECKPDSITHDRIRSSLRPRPEARSFGDPSLAPADPLFGDTRDFFRVAAAIATVHRDGSSGRRYFVEHGCLFGADAVRLGLTRRAPRQSHQLKCDHVLRLPPEPG